MYLPKKQFLNSSRSEDHNATVVLPLGLEKAQIWFFNFLNVSPIMFNEFYCKILFVLTCGILADLISICIGHYCRVLGILFTALKVLYSRPLLPAVVVYEM